MTKFEEEAIKEAEKCGYVMAKSKIVFYEDEKGITFVDFNGTHTNFNFPWLEFAKNWHSDEEFQELKEQNENQAESILLMLDEIKSLKSQLQQQSLPVVPECVAGAIESIPDHYSAFEAIDLIKSKVEVFTEENKDWLQVYNWLCEGIENQDIFALAFITRKYEVEKPQLFYLKNKLTGLWLMRYEIVDKVYPYDHTSDIRNRDTFTQQEIDSMETGSYEQIEVVE